MEPTISIRVFRWEYLTEKLAYERRVRESKLKAAMLQVCFLLFVISSMYIVATTYYR